MDSEVVPGTALTFKSSLLFRNNLFFLRNFSFSEKLRKVTFFLTGIKTYYKTAKKFAKTAHFSVGMVYPEC